MSDWSNVSETTLESLAAQFASVLKEIEEMPAIRLYPPVLVPSWLADALAAEMDAEHRCGRCGAILPRHYNACPNEPGR